MFKWRQWHLKSLHLNISNTLLISLVAQWIRICQPVQKTQEIRVWFMGRDNPLEEGMTTHWSILAWKIPWTEESGGLHSRGSQRVSWAHTHTHTQVSQLRWATWLNSLWFDMYRNNSCVLFFKLEACCVVIISFLDYCTCSIDIANFYSLGAL